MKRKNKLILLLAVIALAGVYFLRVTPEATPVYHLNKHFTITGIYPHDSNAFTQGFIYLEGKFYESTGLYGMSSLRKTDPATGEILKKVKLPDDFFGEGIAAIDDRLYQLTWKSNTGFIYNLDDLTFAGTFSYETEGWGLTTDGTNLIMSDGSSTIYFIDNNDFRILRKVAVYLMDKPLERLNELQYIRGRIFANIFKEEKIVAINADTGNVEFIIDLSDLISKHLDRKAVDVANGIAYDSENNRIFITGKYWPLVFEIEFTSNASLF